MNSNASVLAEPAMGRQLPSVELLPNATGGSSSALADESVEYVREVGLDLDPWQEYCLRTSLADDDGIWSAFIVAIVVGRQNGKGAILEAREIAGLFYVGESLILHSAHEFKTCYEHFLRVVNLVESCPELDRQVQKIRRGVGEQAIELTNGNRLRFIARSSGSGRGMSAPCVILDEAMFLTEAQMGAIMPTLSAQANPQLWVTSSAPLATSVPLHRLRKSAIDQTASRTFYAEWGNDPDAGPLDPEALARANPALGRRIFFDFIETERQSMAPDEFARERLGIPEMPTGAASAPVSPERWADLTDAESMPDDGTVRLALDVTPDQRWASFGLAGKRPDKLLHVSERYHLAPHQMADLVPTAVTFCDGHGVDLVIPHGSPALAWRAELMAAGIEVDVMSAADTAAAFGLLRASVEAGNIRHRGQPELTNAVVGLATRQNGDVMIPTRRSSTVNISPIIAAMCALYRVPGPATTPYAGPMVAVR